MRELILVLSLASIASAQVPSSPPFSYLVRLEHSNRDGHACSLVKASGDFHLEFDGRDETRVFEGQLNPSQLATLEHSLADSTLTNLSQQKIEEPLISTGSDMLEISIFRSDHWQDLLFESTESQAPFAHSLKPLLRWLSNFEKLPHRELSEDAGKNNCLPAKKLILKRRDPSLPESVPKTHVYLAAPIAVPPSRPLESAPISLLFGMVWFRRLGTAAEQSCMLMGDNGQYRFESRVQPSASKAVRSQVSLGRMGEEEIRELRQILDDPNLAKLTHHEPAGGLVVRMMGNMLRLSIRRPQGIQEIVLSSNQRSSGYFYSGDGDLTRARDLLKFLSEHALNKRAENPGSSERNDCQQLP